MEMRLRRRFCLSVDTTEDAPGPAGRNRAKDPEREEPMNQEQESQEYNDNFHEPEDEYYSGGNSRPVKYRDEIFSKRVPAGKRTYFFDVKTTRSGKDFFLTITESKKIDENRYEKHKLYLYKEDFGKFVSAMHEAVRYIRDECLPDYEFRGLPNISLPKEELDEAYSGDEDSY